MAVWSDFPSQTYEFYHTVTGVSVISRDLEGLLWHLRQESTRDITICHPAMRDAFIYS